MQWFRTIPVVLLCMMGACAESVADGPKSQRNGEGGSKTPIAGHREETGGALDRALPQVGGSSSGTMGASGGEMGIGGTLFANGNGANANGGGKGTGGVPFSSASGGGKGTGGTIVAIATGGSRGTGGTSLTPSSGGAKGTGGGRTTGGGETTGADPRIPAVNGSCPEFANGTVTVGGVPILLQVGAKKAGTGSLLFYWHGTGSSASLELGFRFPSSAISEILEEGGIIAGFDGTTGTGGDCSGTAIFSMDDFKIADQIAACAVRDYNIDPRRIYATGCSAGGLQSGCMGALRSSYMAAVVPNSGGLVFNQPMEDKHVPALMTMHGGDSDWVVVSFSDTSVVCDDEMKQAGGFVVNCDHGGGHCGAPSDLYAAGWEFMKAHPFGISPEPYASGLPAGFPSECKIY